MADDAAEQVADAIAEGGQDASSEGGPNRIVLVIMVAVVAVVSAGAGYGINRFLKQAGAQESDLEEPMPTDSDRTREANAEYQYYTDLPAILATLDEKSQNRYLRLKISLAINPKDFEAASEKIRRKQPELINWMFVYFGGCALEDVRGEKNRNRILRVIQDEFNERLWPDRRPLIHHVIYANIVIQ